MEKENSQNGERNTLLDMEKLLQTKKFSRYGDMEKREVTSQLIHSYDLHTP
jgi:hypothetical protein